ncbi:30S ribosomal protein S24e [Candidatus Anstonella stagnisolia]|nr:30S ribosomal protein S24e [Candidatus Anstonella stagnisolia]
MDIEIKGKKENKIIGRQELSCTVGFEKEIPSRKSVRDALCAALGVAPELLIVKSIKGKYGTKNANIIAHVYKDKAGASIESRYLLVRDGLAQKAEKKKAEKKAPAKK